MAAGQRVPVEQSPPSRRRALPEQGRAALAEQIAVMQLVDRVLEVEPAQQRIGRDFGSAQDVAPAVGFDVGEDQQLADAPVEIAPHPLCSGRSSRSNGADRVPADIGSFYI